MSGMMRLIRPDEINAYVKQVTRNNKGLILLYKDSRYDMAVLDEMYGPMGWQVSYSEVKGSLYCTIGVFDPQRSQWVEKTSNGMESDIEAQKGEASDALKRAGFLWGIGRELYTAPTIFIDLNPDEVDTCNGKQRLKLGVTFNVSEIGYDEKRSIDRLTIVDRYGKQRFHWEAGRVSKPRPVQQNAQPVQSNPQPVQNAQQLDAPSMFSPIRPFDPLKAKEQIDMQVGLDKSREIFNSLGISTPRHLQYMAEDTYLKALSMAEQWWRDSLPKETA